MRIGAPEEPIAEYTAFGWTIISGGKEKGFNQMLLARHTEAAQAELCKLYVLESKTKMKAEMIKCIRNSKKSLEEMKSTAMKQICYGK